MAEYLASIFGTEKDKVNCSFYFKIGACRHGERCSRLHNKPTFSQTILLQNMYQNPQSAAQVADGTSSAISDVEAQEHYDRFFEDVFLELEEKATGYVSRGNLSAFDIIGSNARGTAGNDIFTTGNKKSCPSQHCSFAPYSTDNGYGEIEEMNVCDNLGDHLVGNVYVKFRYEEDAEKAVKDLDNRWYNGQPIYAELSPVTDFREACCRQYEMGECTRGGFCNFMHLRPISRDSRRELYGRNRRKRRGAGAGAGAGTAGAKETSPRSRSASPPYTRRSRSRSPPPPPRRRSRSPPRRDRSRSPPRRDRSPRDRDRRGRH